MFLSKKDTPEHYQVTWWAVIINLAACYLNTLVYYDLHGYWNLIAAIVSLSVAIHLGWIIKSRTTKEVWEKLST